MKPIRITCYGMLQPRLTLRGRYALLNVSPARLSRVARAWQTQTALCAARRGFFVHAWPNRGDVACRCYLCAS